MSSSRPTKESFSLKCVLTEAEKLKYGAEMSEAVANLQRKEEELKSVSTQFKAEIASFEARIAALAEKIRSGSEYREVVCEITYDFKKKIRTWTRTDTKEKYKDDIIPERMLQEELALTDKKTEKKKKTKPENEK